VTAKDPVIGRIVSNESCLRGKSASFVRHTVIDIGGTPLEGHCRAGQAFGVIPPGFDANGSPHKVRLYSLACPTSGEDGASRYISTTAKRVILERGPGEPEDSHRLFLGVCSNYLCDLGPGDEVLVCGPCGKRFLLPESPAEHDYLFVATGTGIAPFRGMLLELLGGPSPLAANRIHLIMGAPYTTDLLYDELFSRLSREHGIFRYHTAISREPRNGTSSGPYVHDYLAAHLDEIGPLLADERTLVYACGLAGMQCGLFRVMAEHGLAEPYFEPRGELARIPPREWQPGAMRRGVRLRDRCFVEVY